MKDIYDVIKGKSKEKLRLFWSPQEAFACFFWENHSENERKLNKIRVLDSFDQFTTSTSKVNLKLKL